jgi:hypothetical protein
MHAKGTRAACGAMRTFLHVFPSVGPHRSDDQRPALFGESCVAPAETAGLVRFAAAVF